jgi:hypothetical protein
VYDWEKGSWLKADLLKPLTLTNAQTAAGIVRVRTNSPPFYVGNQLDVSSLSAADAGSTTSGNSGSVGGVAE